MKINFLTARNVLFGYLILANIGTSFAQRSTYLDLLGVGNGKCEEIVAWAGIINQEFPERRNNYGNAVFYRALPLFSDEYFIPTFGKSFMEMKQKDKNKILKSLQTCYSNRKYVNEMNSLYELRSIQAAFKENADQIWNTQNISKGLQEYEKEKQKYKAYEDYLNSDPKNLELEELNKIGTSIGYNPRNTRVRYNNPNSIAFKFIWPSLIADLTNNLESKIPIAQTNKVRAQVESLSSITDPVSLLNQIRSIKDGRELGSLSDAQSKSQFIQQLNGMENSILTDQCAKELITLNKIPTTMNGLAQLNLWEQNFRRSYGQYSNNSSVLELNQQVSLKRESIINQNKAQILSEIQNSNSEESLNLIKGRYMSGLSSTSSIGMEILAAIQTRQYKIDQVQAEKLAQIKAQEAVELQEKIMEVTPDGQPTEFQMRTAYEFQITAGNARKEREKQQAIDIYKNQDMKQIMELFTSLIPESNVEMKNFRKIACQKAVNMPGYFCDFSSVNSTNIQGFNSIQSENEVKTARFVRMDNGVWQYISIK